MEKRDILNYLGQKVGELELPSGTSEEVWTLKLQAYAQPPPSVDMAAIVADRIKQYQQLAPELIIDLYVTNTLAGITTAQSDQMFDDYSDVLIRLREGAWPTALHRLEQKSPSGFVSLELIEAWKQKISSRMQ